MLLACCHADMKKKKKEGEGREGGREGGREEEKKKGEGGRGQGGETLFTNDDGTPEAAA